MCFVWASLYICFLLKKTLQSDAVGHDWRSNLITLCSYCIGPLLWAIITYKRAGHKNVVLMSMIKFFKVYSPLLTRFTNGVKRFQNLPFSLTDFSNTSFSSISFLHHYTYADAVYLCHQFKKKKKKNLCQFGPQLMSPLRSSKLIWPHPPELKSTSLTRARWPTKDPTSQVLLVMVSVHLPVSLWTTWKKRERDNLINCKFRGFWALKIRRVIFTRKLFFGAERK